MGFTQVRIAVRPVPARATIRRSSAALGALLVVLCAVCAGFGWLDLLRSHAVLAVGPALDDSLPLRRLAGEAAQPLARVAFAWVSVGVGAGLILGRLGRVVRLGLLSFSSLLLLVLAAAAAHAVEETQNFASTLFSHRPGIGLVVEATLFTLAAAAIPRRAPR